MSITYETEPSFLPTSQTSNVVIAAMVTAQARLKLYEEIDRLGDRVLYFDTGKAIST